MEYINRITLVGRVEYEPHRGDSNNYAPYLRMVVVTESVGKNKTHKDFHKVLAFGELASICDAKEGDYVEVQGRLSYSKRAQEVGPKIMESAIYAVRIVVL